MLADYPTAKLAVASTLLWTDTPKLLVHPTRLVDVDATRAVFLAILVLSLRVSAVLALAGTLAWYGDDAFYVMNIESDEQGNVLLQLERAVEGREGRQRLDWVEGGDTRTFQRTLDDDRHGWGRRACRRWLRSGGRRDVSTR